MYNSMQKAFTAERREQLKQLSQMPDIYERLARALGMYILYTVCIYECGVLNYSYIIGCRISFVPIIV